MATTSLLDVPILINHDLADDELGVYYSRYGFVSKIECSEQTAEKIRTQFDAEGRLVRR